MRPVESISNTRIGEPQEVALNNMYRLLQSFRRDTFFGREAPASAPVSAVEKLTLRPPVERNVRDVKRALDDATTAAFGGEHPKDDAIEIVESVLRWIAYPRTAKEPSPEDRARTEAFLRELVGRL